MKIHRLFCYGRIASYSSEGNDNSDINTLFCVSFPVWCIDPGDGSKSAIVFRFPVVLIVVEFIEIAFP